LHLFLKRVYQRIGLRMYLGHVPVTIVRILCVSLDTQHRPRMIQGRRSHLQTQIGRKGCSVTRVTECIRSLHTLVVTKTQALQDSSGGESHPPLSSDCWASPSHRGC
jgi:hypothetical protein